VVKWIHGNFMQQLLNFANVPLAVGAAISCIIVFILSGIYVIICTKKIF
jgi:hypothetical protein